MLTGHDLWWRYGRRSDWVLAGHDIAVRHGEVLGLWGPSGCGKSTLASVLAGVRTPQRGRVECDGVELEARRGSRGGPRPVQLVVQQPQRAMNPRWRIGQVLTEAADDGPERALAMGDLVSETWLDRHPHEISGGELQRVNLARALLVRPSYLLADEISSSLDAITQALLWHHLRHEVVERGLGVLAVSHDRALLAEVADRVVDFGSVLDEGEVGEPALQARSVPRAQRSELIDLQRPAGGPARA